MKKILLLLFITLVPSLSKAGTQTGIITQILAHDDGGGNERVEIELDGSSDIDWCSSVEQWAFVLDSELAKAQFSMLLAAYASGKSITINSDPAKTCVNSTRNRVRNVRLN